MNTYKIQLKYDNGIAMVKVHATDKAAAISLITQIENCPERSILSIEEATQ